MIAFCQSVFIKDYDDDDDLKSNWFKLDSKVTIASSSDASDHTVIAANYCSLQCDSDSDMISYHTIYV